jgi:D-alanine-D-alanine ligase
MPLKIGVLMGGVSEEKEVSFSSGASIIKACEDIGYKTVKIEFHGVFKDILADVKSVDLVFNALHGGAGEDGQVQFWLKKNNIKFTGSGAQASKICMNKERSKIITKILGIKTPNWEIFDETFSKPKLKLPYVIKPNEQGSTVGLSLVESQDMVEDALDLAFNYSNNILIEEYIKGRELAVSIVGNDVFPIVEIIPSNKLYDYECKYVPGKSQYLCPADLDSVIDYNIKKDTAMIFEELGCSGYGRADFLLDEHGNYYFLEMNTLPGLTPTSLLPKSAAAAGITFKNLIKNIIEMGI